MLTIHHTKRDFEETDCTVAVLPVGAVEQHGSHLPVGTDTLFAEAFAKGVAVALDAYLLPAIAIASSIEHRKGKGTVYIQSDTLALIVRDIAASLQYAGYRKLIVVNFHGGNWVLKPTIRNLNRELANLDVILLQYDAAAHRHGEIFKHTQGDLHAGEFETSLMLHLYPELVKTIKRPEQAREFVPQAFMDYFDVTELTEDGYWGFPEEGTADKGKRLMELLVQCGLEYLERVERTREEIAQRKNDGIGEQS
ncbi:MAG: creatininase family protein [Paenibacillaceae bacterium]|nr:creatininase family protein [Paenibacillaceae bacterium]